MKMVDSKGWTVSPAVIDGHAQYIVRLPNGILPNVVLGVPYTNPTTPAELAAVGVDLASLKELS